MEEDKLIQIKRGEIPSMQNAYFEECYANILSTVNAIFEGNRGNYSFEDIYQKTRQICSYKKQDVIFEKVTKCLEQNIEIQLNELKQQFKNEGMNVIQVVDQFWTRLNRCIQTVVSLLIYISNSDRNHDLLAFSYSHVKNLFSQQETEIQIITRIYSSVLDTCQEYRLFLLETMKENNDMEIDRSPYNPEVLRQVSNIISMLDILGFYPQLETRHYASLQAFYRTYAYELLINNDITVFLNCIQKIIDIEETICCNMYQSKNLSQIKHETLNTCILLFASEILTKGLSILLNSFQTNYLHLLYTYYQLVDQLDMLKNAIVDTIAKRETEIFTSMTIPEIIHLFRSYIDIVSTCLNNESSFSLSIKTTISTLVNHNIDKCSELLTQWIDHCIQQQHLQKMKLPGSFVDDVMFVLNFMSQRDSFEVLYRKMLFSHIIQYHDILLPEETRIIDELKKICGNVFVSKLDSLAKDAISSKEFAKYIQENSAPSPTRLFTHSQFHLVSKDNTYIMNDDKTLIPEQLMECQKEFEQLYQTRYNSRIIQFLYNESTFMIEYRNCDLRVSYPQYIVLSCFEKVNEMTVGDLQTVSNLPLTTLKGTIVQLASAKNGSILVVKDDELSNASLVQLNENPALKSEVIDCVPPVLLTVKAPTVTVQQDMTAVHKTMIDAAIVRLLKKEKIMSFTQLVCKLASLVNFVPEDTVVKERIDMLISKEYLYRDEKDVNILHYQP